MFLSSVDIQKEITHGELKIEPFSDDQLTPAGIDISIGDRFLQWEDMIPASYRNIFEDNLSNYFMEGLAQDMQFLPSGKTLKVYSLEAVCIPNNIQGIVVSRASLRKVDVSVTSSPLSPGFKGHVLLELENKGPLSYSIPVGSSIAQLLLVYTKTPTDRPYNGEYQDLGNDLSP